MKFPDLSEVFADRYEIRKILGEGAFARVYKAWDQRTGRFVALKILSPKGGEYSELTGARFLREVQIIARLQSPHTITMYDFGQSPSGLRYMACEFLEGRDLHLELMKNPKLPPGVVAHILDQLLQSLMEAHSAGVFHRDIKPANILLTEYQGDAYRATLVDFGLAKPTRGDATQLTKPGKTAGTPRYMAPEQVYAEDMGPPTDLYSLGLVAYEMLVGTPAIDGVDRRDLMQAQLKGPPILLPEGCAPAGLRALIERMTERDLARRYSRAEEVLHDLRDVRRKLRAKSPDASPTGASSPKGSGASGVVLILVVVCLAGSAVALLLLSEPTQAPEDPRPEIPAQLTTVRTPSPEVVARKPVPKPEVEPQNLQNQCTAPPVGMGRIGDVGLIAYAPIGLNSSNVRGVIVLLRRGGVRFTEREFIEYTGLARVADENRLLLLAPPPKALDAGVFGVRTWDDRSTKEAWNRVEDALEDLCMASAPLALLGEAEGAQAADLIQCWNPGRLAAIVGTAHRYDRSTDDPGLRRAARPCQPSTPIPYLEIAHREDKNRPFDGGPACTGTRYPVWSLDEMRKLWKRRQGCTTEDPRRTALRDGTCETWTCQAPYVTCDVDGGLNWAVIVNQTVERQECDGGLSEFPHTAVAWEFLEPYLRPRKAVP